MTPFPPDPSAGVFETLLVHRGWPLELDAHLARLGASTAALFGAGDAAVERIEILEAAGAAELARLRVTVAPGADGQPTREVRMAPVDSRQVFPTKPVELVPTVVPGGLGAHKWADRRLLEAAEEDAGDGAVPLLVDDDATVLEVSRANVFACERGVLVTPPADGRILPGVTRARLLTVARAERVEVRQEPLTLDRLEAADEVFLTGSVRGIEPVRNGPITESLAGALARAWEGGA